MSESVPQNENILLQRRRKQENEKKKVKLLIIIGVLMITLFGILGYAAYQHGGISNLAQGDKDILSNTVENVGTSFAGGNDNENDDEVDYNKPLEVKPKSDTDDAEPTRTTLQHYINFVDGSSNYEITVARNNYIMFKNSSSAPLQIQFSNGQDISLNINERKNVLFSEPGTVAFADAYNTSSAALQVTGIITVTP